MELGSIMLLFLLSGPYRPSRSILKLLMYLLLGEGDKSLRREKHARDRTGAQHVKEKQQVKIGTQNVIKSQKELLVLSV